MSQKLATYGFQLICCDDLIEQKLTPELEKRGYRGIEDVARWMGLPYEERFARNQKKYLQYEIEMELKFKI